MTISGFAWDQRSRLLGISLQDAETLDEVLVLLQPFSGEVYRLPAVEGQLQGLSIQ